MLMGKAATGRFKGKESRMRRRSFLASSLAGIAGMWLGGCRGSQYARVVKPGDKEMTGSHAAGTETYKPLIDEAVANLLARHAPPGPQQVPPGPGMPPPMPCRICFVCVENKSAEEIGDFKDQIYQTIDTKIVESGVFQPVSKRFVDAGLAQTRLRPDSLFVPDNMRAFTAVMEQQGQPFDLLLYATLTSGTTRENKDYQRDYLLTMEMVDVRSGAYDKQSASLSKGYHHSRLSRLMSANPFK